jgi:hypothetical protein
MVRRARSLSSSLPSGWTFWRVVAFLLGDRVQLCLIPDPRRVAGGPTLGSAVDVDLAGDLDKDSTGTAKVVGLRGFGVIAGSPVGWGFALGFAMEADLVFMNPASVGWRSGEDWVSLEAFLRGMISVEASIPRAMSNIQDEC